MGTPLSPRELTYCGMFGAIALLTLMIGVVPPAVTVCRRSARFAPGLGNSIP